MLQAGYGGLPSDFVQRLAHLLCDLRGFSLHFLPGRAADADPLFPRVLSHQAVEKQILIHGKIAVVGIVEAARRGVPELVVLDRFKPLQIRTEELV